MISAPVLLDRELKVVSQYDILPKLGQSMGMMRGVTQMGFVIVDGVGTIRVQQTDLSFGEHTGQMRKIIRLLTAGAAAPPPTHFDLA